MSAKNRGIRRTAIAFSGLSVLLVCGLLPVAPAFAASSTGYSAVISASATSVPGGQSVTLTATANQDMWPTPYGLSIFDTT
ncbi:MAG: hypothetical protein ACRDZX_02235, partial [Acidimicrobiales bacterium]